MTTIPKITSDFAILDVKRGRKGLAKAFEKSNGKLRIPVVIYGEIVGQHSADDGTSIEFSVLIRTLDVEEPS